MLMQVRTSNLDRDQLGDHFDVGIVAIDSGNPRLSSTTLITVRITDINDKAPIFDESSFKSLFVEEDSEIEGVNRIGEGKAIILRI